MHTYKIVSSALMPCSQTGMAFLPDQRTNCFYKICRDAEKAEIEAEMLSYSKQVARSIPSIEIADCQGCNPQEHIVFMRHLAAVDNLFNTFWNRRYWWRLEKIIDARSCGFGLGQWLRRFHVPKLGNAESEVSRIAKGVAGRLNSIEKNSPDLISAACSERLKTVAHNSAALLASDDILVENIHGDLNLSNILVLKNGKLSIIDYADSRVGIGLEDVGIVYHNLTIVSKLRSHSSRNLKAFVNSFLAGYELDLEEAEQELMLFRLHAALVQVLSATTLRKQKRTTKRLLAANLQWLHAI